MRQTPAVVIEAEASREERQQDVREIAHIHDRLTEIARSRYAVDYANDPAALLMKWVARWSPVFWYTYGALMLWMFLMGLRARGIL